MDISIRTGRRLRESGVRALAAALTGIAVLLGVPVTPLVSGVPGVVGRVLSGRAYAAPQDDRRAVDAELERTEILLEGMPEEARRAALAYASALAALSAAERELAEARGRAAAAQAALNQARRDEAAARAEYAIRERDFADAHGAVEALRDEIGAFVAAAYQGAGVAALGALVESQSVSEAAARVAVLDQVTAERRAVLDELTRARFDAKQRQNRAEIARGRAERASRDADAALAAAQAAQRAAELTLARVRDLAAQRKRALAAVDAQRADVLARYAELRVRSQQLTAEIRRAGAGRGASGGTAAAQAGTALLMPVRGWKSSDFGMRLDPYYRVRQPHTGVDLAAPGGEPVRAAADGVVLRAGPAGGYGNLTCVDHGRRDGRTLTTCYAHQSRILVSAGERVTRGQVIGLVGTTGASTGNHLHFEVRVDGVPVDPLRWLPACLC